MNLEYIGKTNVLERDDNFNIDTGHVIPSLIKKCYDAKKQNIPFQVFGTGRPLRQFIFSFDLAKIILYLLFHYLVNEEFYFDLSK